MNRIIKKETKEECFIALRRELGLDARKSTLTFSNYVISILPSKISIGGYYRSYLSIMYIKQRIASESSDGGKWTFLDVINDTFGKNITFADILDEKFYENEFTKDDIIVAKSALMSLIFSYYAATEDYQKVYSALYKILKENTLTLDNFSMIQPPKTKAYLNLIMGLADYNSKKEDSKKKTYTRYFRTFNETFYWNCKVMEQDELLSDSTFLKFKDAASKVYKKLDDATFAYASIRSNYIDENMFLDLMESSDSYLAEGIKNGRYADRRFKISEAGMERIKNIFRSYLNNRYVSTNRSKDLTSDIKNMIDVMDKYNYNFDIFEVVMDLPPKIQSAALEAQIS